MRPTTFAVYASVFLIFCLNNLSIPHTSSISLYSTCKSTDWKAAAALLFPAACAYSKRIRGRRFDGAGAQEQKQRPFILFRMIYHAVMLMMCICVVVLALLLNQKLNLVKMPAVIQQFHLEDLGSWLPFENWFSLKEEPVSTSPVYTLLKDDHYSNGTNQARSGYAGVVLHVQKQADKKSSVTVKQDNGAVVTYGNLNEVKVKQDDRILKEAVLGTADSYVTINALKDNEKIKVSDAFS